MSQALRGVVGGLSAGSSILLPGACATVPGLADAIVADAERLTGSRTWSGLLLDADALADPAPWERLRYGTWHVARPLADLATRGTLDYYPLRASNVVDFVRRKGADDVVVVHVAPPDADGWSSLGVSGSYCAAAAASARHLIALVNPRMPRSLGCRINLDDAAVTVTVEQELVEHRSAPPDATSTRIAGWIEPLVRDGATVQAGLGSVPEAVLETLLASDRTQLGIWGMATDGVVALDEAGKLQGGRDPVVHAHDVFGTRRVFDWVAGNERFRLVGYDVGASVAAISAIPGFVSINSAIEVDLAGNANVEVLGGRIISGIGGSLDFAEGARRAPGGVSVLALPATARGGRVSRIVPRLSRVPHSIPRTTVQHVVTEHGIVDLSLLSVTDRAQALIGLAAPQFRDELEEQHREQRRDAPGGHPLR